MIAIILAIFASCGLNLLLQFASRHYSYNVPFILLIVECSKLLVCLIGMLCISNQRNCPIRFGFIVNSILYAIVNYLSHFITKSMPVSIYSVLIQHKIIWVVLFSILILKKKFSIKQFLALIVICFGCILTKLSADKIIISEIGLFLVIFQGICSSLSSVWIEKMMKMDDRPVVSENASKNKLYWFLADSFQMYLFAIPIYLVGTYSHSKIKNTLPIELSVIIVVLSVLNGMSLGAVFVYHSSVVRSVISAIVIVVLAIDHGIWSVYTISGIACVLLGVIAWSLSSKI